jgi:uncharacterized protein YbjT (DUF2867 family)
VDVVLGDALQPATLAPALTGIDALVIVTGAKPKILLSSLPGTMFRKMILGDTTARPSFYYDPGQGPEQNDWEGQRNQIDAAKAAGVKHVVLVSSMGGVTPDHFLTSAATGHIALWKRKSERYLIASGLPYTIIHPSGLMPHPPKNLPAPGGERELVVALDDGLVGDPKRNQIPREDAAEVVVKVLTTPEALNRSFDLSSKPPGEGTVFNGDLAALLANLNGGNCKYDEPEWP